MKFTLFDDMRVVKLVPAFANNQAKEASARHGQEAVVAWKEHLQPTNTVSLSPLPGD